MISQNYMLIRQEYIDVSIANILYGLYTFNFNHKNGILLYWVFQKVFKSTMKLKNKMKVYIL